MIIPTWLVVAPFLWAPALSALAGWSALALVDRRRGSFGARRAARVAVACAAACAGGFVIGASPSLGEATWPAGLGMGALCGLAAWTGGRRLERRGPASPSADPIAPAERGSPRADVGLAALGVTAASAAAVGLVVVAALATRGTEWTLAIAPRDPGALLDLAKAALASDRPSLARARADLAERAGADYAVVARVRADAWAADGDCRRAWAALETVTRRDLERGELTLREGLVGPTLARRCPRGTHPREPAPATSR